MKKGNNNLTFIDLFAGAGGLSEGFIRQGFTPVAHVEMNKEACNTLKTRLAFHQLSKIKNLDVYLAYLKNEISRDELWSKIPQKLLNTVINAEISELTIKNIFKHIDEQLNSDKVDIIIGGPPCQAYSIVGRSRDPNRMKGDKRNYLFRYYAEFLSKYKPEYFVFENVQGILSAGSKLYLNEMLQLFSEKGYTTAISILNAEEFGVLQKRKRVVIIGHRSKNTFTFPLLKTIENNFQLKRDLFEDLPKLKPGEILSNAKYIKSTNNYLKENKIRSEVDFVTQHMTRNHNELDLEIYSIAIDKWIKKKERLKYDELPSRLQTHNKKDIFLDRFKVVDPTGCSHTIVAHIAKDGHYYIYPDAKQIRSISVREAARIQSFPDDYYFEGGRTAAFKQIGNAVPPLMAEKIAQSIFKLF
jgi:DNA (cytosine-5)-methyltransferase 1